MTVVLKNALVDSKLVDIEISDGKIEKIGKSDDNAGIDLGGRKVFAGLVDIHTHGCVGYDTMDGDGLLQMSEFLLKNGVTAWLPTTMTMDIKTIKGVTNATLADTSGARILGYHMEGPYISPKYKGAQNERFIKSPDLDEFKSLSNVKKITIAPELHKSMEFIKNCDCVVSLGHTDADYDCAMEAFKNGAKCLTHTFNAMPPLHHRNAGPIGAAIDSDAYVEVICDGLHIHRSVIKMLYRTFGADRMILISDSMRATGLSDGEYEFGGQMITVKDSVARTADGAIAGSTSTLLDCVKKAIEFGIPERDAFKMASETPATLIGVNKGKIEVGYDADLIVTDDNYNVVLAIIGGKVQNTQFIKRIDD